MKKVTLLSIAVLPLIFGSCSDSQFDGYKKAENGLHYKFYEQDENGKKVQLGDGITIRYIITKESNDSVIIDSKKVSEDGSGYIPFGLSKSSFTGSFEDGMLMMSKGDSAAFIVSADSFFLKTNQQTELPKGFKPGDHLKAIIKVKDIKSKEELAENQKKQAMEQEAMMKMAQEKEKPETEKYLADNNIKTKPTESGLIYIETKKGTGPNPKGAEVVVVNYTGKLLDGTTFDSSEGKGPAEYPLDKWVPGFSEGLAKMKKGGKAKMIVPSAIAYGARGGGPIPPFATLVFDVELVDIKPAQAQQPEQMPAQ